MATPDALCRSYLDLWWHFDPAAASRAGVAGHEGRLGSYGADALRTHLAAFRSIAGAVEELDVEETADEIDRTALLDRLRVLLFRLEQERPWRHNPALWLEHLAEAFALPGAPATTERLRAVPAFLTDALETLRQPPRFLLETALAQLRPLTALLETAAGPFEAEGGELAGESAAALTEARTALARFEHALAGGSFDPDPFGAALGEAAVDRRLHHEHASIHNAAELLRAGLRLAADVERQVVALAAAVDVGRPWRDVYAATRQSGDVPARGLLAAMRDEADAAARFGAERLGLGTPPLDVVALPAPARVCEPFARYRAAGASPAVLELGEADAVMLPWLAIRLGGPGVHLHDVKQRELARLVRRHVTVSSTPQGWGLSLMELAAERGFRSEPEARLAERVMLLSAVQLALADLGLHTRQLTPEEAVDQLVGRLPLDRASALAWVRRLACHPTEACAAILGWQELGRLQGDQERARGSDFRLERFHADVLAYGGLPVPLMRWGMGLDG